MNKSTTKRIRKPQIEFHARPGGFLTEKKAQTYGPILDRIKEETGSFGPEKVVDAARPEASPLHKEFCWDNTKAAEAYRRVQARRLIADIILVQVTSRNKPAESTRFFQSVKGANGKRGYVSVLDLAKDAELAQQVYAKAKHALIYWRDHCKQYEEENLQRLARALEGVLETEQLLLGDHDQAAAASTLPARPRSGAPASV